MRIGIYISSCEWNMVEQVASEMGFKNGESFIQCQMRKISLRIPETAMIGCVKEKRMFTISDEEAIAKIERYCQSNTLNPATLMRRLVVDPVVGKYLLGEALVLQR